MEDLPAVADGDLVPAASGPVLPQRNPALVYLAGLRARTSRASQASALRMILRAIEPAGETLAVASFPWHLLRTEHVRAIDGRLNARAKAYKPATLRRLLTALRRVLRVSWQLGYVTGDELAKAVELPRVLGKSLPAGRALPSPEVGRLFDACDPTTAQGARTLAAMALLFGGAMRRAEAVSLHLHNFDPDARTVTVIGKRSVERLITLGAWADYIDDWFRVRGTSPGPILCRLGRWDRIMPAKGITPTQLYMVLERLGKRASVKFSPHDGRRTAITAQLRSGVDLRFVQANAGHDSPETTARYDRRTVDERIAAISGAGLAALGRPARNRRGNP